MIKQIIIICQVIVFLSAGLVCYADDMIDELPPLTTPADDDTYVLVDDDAGTTKSITHSNLKAAIQIPTASAAETEAGTEDAKAVTPDGLHDMLLDEDDMASDSATKFSSQQAIKAYVDNHDTIQTVVGMFNSLSTTALTIPYDDTVPAFTEGLIAAQVQITPTASDNILSARFNCQASSSATSPLQAALFNETTCFGAGSEKVTGGNDAVQMYLEAETVAGTTNQLTITARVGAHTGTTTVNGNAGLRYLGGKSYCTLIVEEREP
jgi:hypothetical protein